MAQWSNEHAKGAEEKINEAADDAVASAKHFFEWHMVEVTEQMDVKRIG